jgi:cytochrome c556
MVRGEADIFGPVHMQEGRITMNRQRLFIWSAIAVAVAVTISAAAMTATEAIKQRQKEMEGIGTAMKNLGAIAKNEQPFDANVVATNAATIADNLAQAAMLFPDGSDVGDVETRAKPEIWTEREQFERFLENARQAAIELESVTEAEAFPPALGKLGNACKSCHDLYRLPKN